jgi:hypothetical protein
MLRLARTGNRREPTEVIMLSRLRKLVLSALLFGLLAIVAPVGPPASADEPPPQEWPKVLQFERGTVLIYQPQIESLEGDRLRSRAAVSVSLVGEDTTPKFGVIWSDARILTDRDARTVKILGIDVTDVRFPEITDDQKTRFMEFVEKKVEERDLVISLDRVLASLAAVEDEQKLADELNNDPPTILYSDAPAVLIVIDGEPRYRTLDDGKLKLVANTPYTLAYDPKKEKFYLDGGIEWYVAGNIVGPYEVISKPPKKIRELRTDKAQREADDARAGIEDYEPPDVVVVTEPSEMIVTDGEAQYAPIQGTNALAVTNADNDVLLDVPSQEHFVLLSGRWYRSKTLAGPWTFVSSDALPESFSAIPEDSAQAHLLVSIAGTVQAREALMDNQIPQTAAVKRGSVKLMVEYDGTPKFRPIEGTDMEYAINTSFSVLKIDGRYWLCHQAVWYTGAAPTGPWEVATFRPESVADIPPSNPHYNTKYVYVYDSTPDVVYVGYTPGYVGSYSYGGCVVYGTGWYYTGWYGRYYYPYTATWGFSMRYNPWYGWGVGVTWSNGPFTISIGTGGYGGWGYPYNYWGPRGFAYVPVPVHVGRPVYRPPGSWDPGSRRPGDRPTIQPADARGSGAADRLAGGRDNLYNRPENRARVADRAPGRGSDRVADRPNDVFAGRDGNVYRRDGNGGWQQREGGDWKGVDPAKADRARQAAGDRTRQSGTPRQTGSSRPTSGLERDHSGRTRGTQRMSGYSGGFGSRGGGMARPRGGGGRRR